MDSRGTGRQESGAREGVAQGLAGRPVFALAFSVASGRLAEPAA